MRELEKASQEPHEIKYLRGELEGFAREGLKDRTYALAVHDQWRYVDAGSRIETAKAELSSARPEELEEKKADLVAAKLEQRLIGGKMDLRGITLGKHYIVARQNFEGVVNELRHEYKKAPGATSGGIETKLAADLKAARNILVQ